MLTKESSHGFSPQSNYPTYEYQSKSGRRTQGHCDGSRMIPTPKGYREIIRFKDEDEDFASYLKWIEEEHKDVPDSKLRENPFGIFIGTWRNARWFDEGLRRGVLKLER